MKLQVFFPPCGRGNPEINKYKIDVSPFFVSYLFFFVLLVWKTLAQKFRKMFQIKYHGPKNPYILQGTIECDRFTCTVISNRKRMFHEFKIKNTVLLTVACPGTFNWGADKNRWRDVIEMLPISKKNRYTRSFDNQLYIILR